MKRELQTTLVAAAATLALSATVQAQQTIDRTLPAHPNVEISVENVSGRVSVHVGEAEQVRLQAVLGPDVETLDVSGDAGGYHFEVEIVDDRGWHNRKVDIDSTIELWVPAGAAVEVETVSASVDVRGVSGGAAVETVSGGIDLAGVSGGVEAESVSGRVTVSASGGPVYAESVSGRVEITGARDEVHAGSVSGSVLISDFSGSEAYMETVSGSIRFEGDLVPGAELGAESVSGSVELMLPADLGAAFDVETFSGSIRSAFGGQVHEVSKYGPGKILDHKTGDAAEVSVETMSGSVTISHR